jgi:hypothetical protein
MFDNPLYQMLEMLIVVVVIIIVMMVKMVVMIPVGNGVGDGPLDVGL